MSPTPDNVLVFGGAGAVGRNAAISASKHGAKVYLAMRDLQKPIPSLSKADEEKARFERVQADLSNPSSLKAAVATSKATIAFVYAITEAQDAMKSAFEALKEAGITTIILLSSFSVKPSAEEAQHYKYLPAKHAAIELQLIESGLSYVTVRPGYFNSNTLWYKDGIKSGEVKLFGTKACFDFIAPEDIGAAIGKLLTTPSPHLPMNEKNGKSVHICGPRVMSVEESLGIIGSVLGKEVRVVETGEEGFWVAFAHLPKPIAESILENTKACIPPRADFSGEFWSKAAENLSAYKEGEPMGFKEWVEAHRDEFE